MTVTATPDASEQAKACDHGVTFDEAVAKAIPNNWNPSNPREFIAGPPSTHEIRKRWPRLHGVCPKGCGFDGIAYASMTHYLYGDW